MKTILLTIAAFVASLAALSATAQPPVARLLPPIESIEQAPFPGVVDESALAFARDAQAITLTAALRLTGTANLDIAQARTVVDQARAAFERARVSFLPNLNLGSTYSKHEGNIAKTEGNIIKANKDALFVGGGPSLAFGLAEAIFTPLVARQVATATQAGLQRVNNDTFLAVADAYFNVLRARRRLARVDETLDYLTSPSPSPGRAGSRGLLPVVIAVQEAGGKEALKAEVERVRVEALRRQEERQGAIQEFLVASAELARLIRLAPDIPLWPLEDFRFPLPVPVEPYMARTLEQLIDLALNNRPELAESQALVRAAEERLRAAQFRPLLPNLVVNYNWGDFGGGPDLNAPIISGNKVTAVPGFGPSGQLHHFNTRADLDATLVWRLQNLGFGNLAEMREQRAAMRQGQLRLLQVRDRVVTQVVQARELVEGWRARLESTRQALFDSAGKAQGPVFRSLLLNFQRIRGVLETRPLEVLDSIRGLNDMLEAYGQAVTDYERARFRLLIALGLPPQTILETLTACAPALTRGEH
ncbi:MAG TPA: TolC family protein [Gemmataceae bacterium]|nr:TolC family protein [Gemmataceae bacterium]